MLAFQITPEYEYLIRLERNDMIRCYSPHGSVFSKVPKGTSITKGSEINPFSDVALFAVSFTTIGALDVP